MMKSFLNKIAIIIALLATGLAGRAQINTDQVLRVGQNALYFEDYVLSIQYFNQAIQSKPYLPQPYLMRAIAKLNLEDYRGAIDDASKCISINPYLPDAWEVRGVARQNLGLNRGAIDDYNEALALLPNNRNILFNKALAQEDEGLIEQADTTISEILKHYRLYDKAYVARAKLRLEAGDTLAAEEDVDKAIKLNPNMLNSYLFRASIAIDKHKDYEKALADMDKAIKLEPKLSGLYINRAFLRHELDDYFGAMADFDYALDLEPLSSTALFNRSLLLMEVGDNDRALLDLNRLLKITPDDERALYNRSIVYSEKKDFDKAIADISEVIGKMPSFSSAYFMRSEFYREKGDMKNAKADYEHAMALARKNASEKPQDIAAGANQNAKEAIVDDTLPEELTRESAANRFNALLTIDNDTRIDGDYNNQAIRGRVQDRDIQIDIEPYIDVSLYSSPGELSENTYQMKEVDDINASRMLRFMVFVTSRPVRLSDPELIKRHFESIDYYNSYLATHQPRTIDYLGRALDFITLRNYQAAISDLDRAVEMNPDHALAYMLRAQSRYYQSLESAPYDRAETGLSSLDTRRESLALALADIDRAIQYSPRTSALWYDKGNILYSMGNLPAASEAYTKAIELEPSMGEAYFNRGYIKLKAGDEKGGIDDLSKAGELGKVAAYNLIKRVRRVR
ncbi:MAG: tetratricopeptide repeat protein [Clostridium sp.]|nr:tetratricopeptide repeat protein [Clostridium sp.]